MGDHANCPWYSIRWSIPLWIVLPIQMAIITALRRDWAVGYQRHLRFASAVFALLTVAIGVLWVRSYRWEDFVGRTDQQRGFQISSCDGVLCASSFKISKISRTGVPYCCPLPDPGWYCSNSDAANSSVSWCWAVNRDGFKISAPHWLPFLFCINLAVLPWAALPWATGGFSLRTLLIATTVVAVVLGLAVWAGR